MSEQNNERGVLVDAFKQSAHKWDSYDFDPDYDYSEEAGVLADVVLALGFHQQNRVSA